MGVGVRVCVGVCARVGRGAGPRSLCRPVSHCCLLLASLPPCPTQALSHAPRLRSLAINSCTKVTDRGLLALCRSAGLRHLSVDRCPQLGAPALGALQRKLVLLRLARPAGGRHTAILEY